MTIYENIASQPEWVKKEIDYLRQERPDLYENIIKGTLDEYLKTKNS